MKSVKQRKIRYELEVKVPGSPYGWEPCDEAESWKEINYLKSEYRKAFTKACFFRVNKYITVKRG